MQGRRVPFAPLGFQRFAGPHQNLDALSLGLQQEPAPPADWGVPSADPDMEHFDELMQGIQAYQPPTMMAPSLNRYSSDPICGTSCRCSRSCRYGLAKMIGPPGCGGSR